MNGDNKVNNSLIDSALQVGHMDSERKTALNIRTQLMIAHQAIVQALIYANDMQDRELHCILSDIHASELSDSLKNGINELTSTYQFKNPW